jgi:hypothetical protein
MSYNKEEIWEQYILISINTTLYIYNSRWTFARPHPVFLSCLFASVDEMSAKNEWRNVTIPALTTVLADDTAYFPLRYGITVPLNEVV